MELFQSRFTEELETALSAAEKAGEKIDEYVRDGFDSRKKTDGSIVTEADEEAQRVIVNHIKSSFSEDGFLGEEQNLEPEEEERVWVIDPIDGTFNFEKDFEAYCVSIALRVGGTTVLGIVHSPETAEDKTYFAVEDCGAYLAEDTGIEEATRIRTSNHSGIEDAIFFSTAFDIYPGELEREIKVLKELARRDAVHRQKGSAALEICELAEGKADLLYNPILKEWDFAAGKIILEEAGGKMEVRDSPFPNSREIIASNGIIHDEVIEIIGEVLENG